MTTAALLSPIAAATVLNCFLFALAWRGDRTELRTGKTPWPLVLGIITYCAAVGGFLYFSGGAPLLTGFDRFMAALAGEALGALIMYALLYAFVHSRGQPWRDRAFPILGAVFLSGVMFAALFQG